MKGVLVPQSGDRYQVVIGGAVATMYENIMHLPEMAGVGAGKGAVAGDMRCQTSAPRCAAKSRGWTRSSSACPTRSALGLIIALINLVGVVPGEEANTSLVFIKAIWKGVFYFLPIMIAYNASKKLKSDPCWSAPLCLMVASPT